ncbi:hypothetical protein EZV62_005671 [Acer yangbiense]|uniref:Uncharacterized protein n=1 Tax=Acer yangbiense TaxID=1000413 RepID=A0A5C7IQJ5_9ROSI|nr:hypothetical protein EZV62_005671 [Acer yangbiense]
MCSTARGARRPEVSDGQRCGDSSNHGDSSNNDGGVCDGQRSATTRCVQRPEISSTSNPDFVHLQPRFLLSLRFVHFIYFVHLQPRFRPPPTRSFFVSLKPSNNLEPKPLCRSRSGAERPSTRLIPSSGDAQNRETRSFAQRVSRKISDAIAKAKVMLQIASIN